MTSPPKRLSSFSKLKKAPNLKKTFIKELNIDTPLNKIPKSLSERSKTEPTRIYFNEEKEEEKIIENNIKENYKIEETEEKEENENEIKINKVETIFIEEKGKLGNNITEYKFDNDGGGFFNWFCCKNDHESISFEDNDNNNKLMSCHIF